MMIRAPLGDLSYWMEWVSYGDEYIGESWKKAASPPGDPSYEPQYLFVLAQNHLHQMLRKYSAGRPVVELVGYFPCLLDAWERSQALGERQWSAEECFTRRAWRVNYDHYIVCFWLVGLALALDLPDSQWQRLLKIIGNDGEDVLLDSVIATRSPERRVSDTLLYPKPYERLLKAIRAPRSEQALLLRDCVEKWYPEVGGGAKSGSHVQAAAYKHPYWYRYGEENFAGGAYFGRWCVEAVAAVKAFGLDDSQCLNLEHYPKALLHPEQHSTPIEGSTASLKKPKSFWERLFKRSQ